MNEVLIRITKRMEEKGISQRQLTKKLNIGETNFHSWKIGKTNSYMKKLPEIAKILDVSIEWLINGTDEPVNEEKELYRHFQAVPEHLQRAVKIILNME